MAQNYYQKEAETMPYEQIRALTDETLTNHGFTVLQNDDLANL